MSIRTNRISLYLKNSSAVLSDFDRMIYRQGESSILREDLINFIDTLCEKIDYIPQQKTFDLEIEEVKEEVKKTPTVNRKKTS